jgi:hypothetical protein
MKLKSTGTKRTESAAGSSRSSASSTEQFRRRRYPFYALCIHNNGSPASLELGKAYQVIKPEKNDPAHSLRIVDEEGEDYLYDADWFAPLDLPPRARKALQAAR